MSKLLERVVDELSKLPGVGKRTAMRFSLHLLRQGGEEVEALARSITNFRNGIKFCAHCNNLSDTDLCPVCADRARDRTVVCVVEQVRDVMSIENTMQYKGLYHVLGGVISPMMGIGPSDLKIDLLLENIARHGVKEVILALGTTIEGETTSYYISRKLQGAEVKISSIARGIGFGDELEYADELTIIHAINNRIPLK